MNRAVTSTTMNVNGVNNDVIANNAHSTVHSTPITAPTMNLNDVNNGIKDNDGIFCDI